MTKNLENSFKTQELNYDITRIPAVWQALEEMPEQEAEEGRGKSWDELLECAAMYMDDEIREELHAVWADDWSTSQFLCVYAARHEAEFGTPFSF